MAENLKRVIASKYEYRTGYSQQVFSNSGTIEIDAESPFSVVQVEQGLLDLEVTLNTLISAYDSGNMVDNANPNLAFDTFQPLFLKLVSIRKLVTEVKVKLGAESIHYNNIKDSYIRLRSLLIEYMDFVNEETAGQPNDSTTMGVRLMQAEEKVRAKV